MQASWWKSISKLDDDQQKAIALDDDDDHLGLRGNGPADPRYCIIDEKVRRVYYTRSGIERMLEALRSTPSEALASIASISTIDQFRAQ